MRGSHGLPPSLLGPIGKRFRRQTVPHLLTPEACPTRIREVLRLVLKLDAALEGSHAGETVRRNAALPTGAGRPGGAARPPFGPVQSPRSLEHSEGVTGPRGISGSGGDRETREEAGVNAGELVELGSIHYTKSRKQIHCFAGPAPGNAEPRCASWEVDCAEFLTMTEARQQIHPEQAPFLDRLVNCCERLESRSREPRGTKPRLNGCARFVQHMVAVGCDKLAGVLLPARTMMTASAGTPQCGWPWFSSGSVHALVCLRSPSRFLAGQRTSRRACHTLPRKCPNCAR